MSLSLAYGHFASTLALEHLPAEAVEVVRAGTIDTVGTLLAARDESEIDMLRRGLGAPAGGGARLLLGVTRVAAADAAIVNGTAAHLLDFDDVAMHAHPSTVLVPAVLALGQDLGASGAELLVAYAAGYEVWADLARRESQLHHEKGWHPTGVIGAVAAAVACARLLHASPEVIAHAAGLGASMGAGLTVNFGSMAKPMHAGRAAQSGVVAARLASAGFTASREAIEHPRGFLAAISPEGRVDLASPADGLGREWALLHGGLNIKRFPTCYCTHRSIDAMLELREREHWMPADLERIEAIEVLISEEHARVLLNHRPTTALQAKFSIEFAMAGAAVAGAVGLAQLEDDFVRDPRVQQLVPRVTVKHSSERMPGNPSAALHDQVSVRMADGRVLKSEPVSFAKGHAKRPLAIAERRAKFMDCAERGTSSAAAHSLYELLERIESLDDVAVLQA